MSWIADFIDFEVPSPEPKTKHKWNVRLHWPLYPWTIGDCMEGKCPVSHDIWMPDYYDPPGHFMCPWSPLCAPPRFHLHIDERYWEFAADADRWLEWKRQYEHDLIDPAEKRQFDSVEERLDYLVSVKKDKLKVVQEKHDKEEEDRNVARLLSECEVRSAQREFLEAKKKASDYREEALLANVNNRPTKKTRKARTT